MPTYALTAVTCNNTYVGAPNIILHFTNSCGAFVGGRAKPVPKFGKAIEFPILGQAMRLLCTPIIIATGTNQELQG